MIKKYSRSAFSVLFVLFTSFYLFTCAPAKGQGLMVYLGGVDGIDLTPGNIFNYQVSSSLPDRTEILIKGLIKYRQSDMRISYTLKVPLSKGMNNMNAFQSKAVWEFSSGALRELFLNYGFLPLGTYEYCVTVTRSWLREGVVNEVAEDCLYRQAKDLFFISLITPEDNAKIYEFNPMLSWVVNYPFGSSLSYRVRVAEIKEGQNTANAVTRNNPVYSESHVLQTSRVYPVYAKPLKAFQPYAWTVDAYYKGILLGGAAPWRFTIIEDSLLVASIPKDISYLDIKREKGGNQVWAIGTLKLAYELKDLKQDSLSLRLMSDNQEVPLPRQKIGAVVGNNFFDIDFTDSPRLRHLKVYTLFITNTLGTSYIVSFKYVNPDYLN